MNLQKIVIDTNIVISAMLSNRGAAFKLISLIRNQKFKYVLSVPLVLEYEDVLKRKDSKITLSQEAINNILDRLCYHAELRDIFYLWRPFLNDPKDDLVLELAVESNCNSIVTYNLKDFENIDKFGLKAVTPKTFLQQIGVI
ncbi:MAG: putative toxin-antitoxin system toxin component, PIN family [gamma proteobacterium symbiont of Taylorina sp.]|nr:putative toxin-antitoxin system toxin component, PIN family [gamma proteobacterium symbiont of Taylorina sp.]